MRLPAGIRDAIPLGLRRQLRLGQRAFGDFFGGAIARCPARQDISDWPVAVTVRQALTTTPNSEAKRHNIALAASAFSARPVSPNGVFSFWGWLGAPSCHRGFREGRALRGDKLILETGGGLCQLAGALYYAGLQAGMIPVERHAHSADLYTDDTRYTPLGSDATVSYGFKDLRLRNGRDVSIAFDIDVCAETLAVMVRSERPIAALVPEFRQHSNPDGVVTVETWVAGNLVTRSRYKRL